MDRIASSEEYIPLDVALPPAGNPDEAAMAEARQALSSLQAAGRAPGLVGEGALGSYLPVHGFSGAAKLLRQLLDSSQLPPGLTSRQVCICLT